MRRNIIPIFTMVIIGTVISVVHCDFYGVLCIYCIPIAMTAAFSNRKLCNIVTLMCTVGAGAAILRHLFLMNTTSGRIKVILEGIMAICMLYFANKVIHTLLNMTEEQRGKLTNFAKNIKEAQFKAEAANKAKSAFLANMSHEIRTPINAILGMDEMIIRESESRQIEDYAKSIQLAGNSLLYLINDVLDISKIESGRMEIMESTYDTASLVHDCYNMIAERATKKGLELKVECNPKLPSRLKGDEARMRQVVTNLLSNAAKYTKKGSVTLSVDYKTEEGKFSLIATVRDTGIGIKEDDVKKLFSQFTRFDLDKNRNIEGTGLGLAITKQLVDLMQGDIQVQSIYGVGSSFTVIIPQQVIDNTPMGEFVNTYREVNGENEKYQQSFEAPDAKILVVDDVEVNLKVIVNLLKKTKIKVDTAQSGKQCIAMASVNKYDIIFMDHMMPEMNGVETYTKMKEIQGFINKNTPVIMLTANAITGVKEEYLKVGFADYLSKPVMGDKLERMIIKFLPYSKFKAGAQPEGSVQGDMAGGVEDAYTDFKKTADTASASSTDKLSQAATSNIVLLQSLFQEYPKVDFTQGLSICGQDSGIYISVLRTYGEDSKVDELNSYFDEEKIQDYQILAHGIKGASLNVGFTELSDMARALEDAAREKNWDYIREHHAPFVAEYKSAIDAILRTMPQED